MEDDLKKKRLKKGRRPQKKSENGRQPQKKKVRDNHPTPKNRRRPLKKIKMKDDLKKNKK